nr:MAG TPA: hypothetical protein [Caudoviricetes sp.]
MLAEDIRIKNVMGVKKNSLFFKKIFEKSIALIKKV